VKILFAFADGGAAERFDIYVPSEADVVAARALVPAEVLPITRFHVGVPRPVRENDR
jgi:hypothetical protein